MLPEWLDGPLRAVLHDLQRPTPVKVKVEYRPGAEWDELHGAWAEARPACPGHPHPAVPLELDGQAWWMCPRDERRIARIGEHAA
jgi:hypothetical protein